MRSRNGRLTANVLAQYSREYPSPANAVRLFEGEWASALPSVDNVELASGKSLLFEDPRIAWANEEFDFRNKTVLELGPLEGGHSFMMERMGAKHVLALEANSRAFLKCLIVKDLYRLEKCNFLLGDFVQFLKASSSKFDCCIASGVLYHMQNPAELISLIARASDRALIWTHYYDEKILGKRTFYGYKRFGAEEPAEFEGFAYKRVKQRYGLGLKRLGFCGGTAPFSYWMSRTGIVDCLKHFGFRRVEENFHQPDHVDGPAICFACFR